MFACPIRRALRGATALALSAVVPLSSRAAAQRPVVSRADSALVGRILRAEDRRDSSDRALRVGLSSHNARIQLLARRALERIRDPRFTGRDSLPALPAPKAWPEPDWLLRLRALPSRRQDCAAIRGALADSAWPVRLRAADLADTSCAADTAVVATLRSWVDGMPSDVSSRSPGGVSWHGAAHAVVALARLRPGDARPLAARLAAHEQWQLRVYAARALGILGDSAGLRAQVRDRDDDVKEAAIVALSKLTGHADDSLYVAALASNGAQAVRAAALALTGSPSVDARRAASSAFERWVARDNASARDARLALLAAAGRPATDDRPPPTLVELPARAVALALGADARVRVTMAPSSGGGSFVVKLRGDIAPITAARILDLVNRNYYDGLTWQRVEPDFVIQGGSPGANEYVGYRRYFRDELGNVPHLRGTVGMSTRGHDTGDAQWFVNLRDNRRLDRDYTLFGEIVEGMQVVDGVLEGDTIERIEELPAASR